MYYFYGLLGLDRRTFVWSELPEFFFVYQFALNKMACSTSLGYFWTFSRLLGILWMSLAQKIDANLHQFTLTKGGCTKIKLMQKAPSNGILHQLHQNYILLKFQNLISKTWNFLLRKMKFSIKNMKFSIKNMKFSIYEICQNSSFVLFVTEFSYHMYRKNAVLNGKQKQMKPLLVLLCESGYSCEHHSILDPG